MATILWAVANAFDADLSAWWLMYTIAWDVVKLQ